MSDIWVIIANSSQASLYKANFNVNGGQLHLIKEIHHPESRIKSTQIASDRSGNYQSNITKNGSYSGAIEPHNYESERFAQHLATILNRGRTAQDFSNLIIIASPHFLGLLRKNLNARVHDLISHSIEKDYTKLAPAAIAKHIYQHVYL